MRETIETWYMAKPISDFKVLSKIKGSGHLKINITHAGFDFGLAVIPPEKYLQWMKGEGVRITEAHLRTPSFIVNSHDED